MRHAEPFSGLPCDQHRHGALLAAGVAPDPHFDADDGIAIQIGYLDRIDRRHQSMIAAFTYADALGKSINASEGNIQIS